MSNIQEKKFILYKYTCKHNGLIYFGITSKTLAQRWSNGYGYKGNPRLHRTIQKYGEEGFIREIVLQDLTYEEACAAEIEYIEKYHATDKEVGFNIAKGGTAPMFGRHHSEETRLHFSATRKGEHNNFYGKHHSEATKQKLSEQRKGIPLSEEHKQHISESEKGMFAGEKNPMYGDHRFAGENNPMYGIRGGDNPNAVAVAQLNENNEILHIFTSTTEAAQSVGLFNGSHITECCKGKRNKAGGYRWKYIIIKDCEEDE